MSYIIKRNNKRYNNKVFSNYEQARSYIRKKIRSNTSDYNLPDKSLCDVGWVFHNNPSHSRYGFSIVKAN